jgi:hypothetical protein
MRFIRPVLAFSVPAVGLLLACSGTEIGRKSDPSIGKKRPEDPVISGDSGAPQPPEVKTSPPTSAPPATAPARPTPPPDALPPDASPPPPEASPPPPDGTVVPPATAGCIETSVRGGGGFSGGTEYTRKTWDPKTRILVAEYSITPTFDIVSTLKWKYAAEGRAIAYIGVEQPFQHDYRYDTHDNVVDFVLSYPSTPDLNTPSSAAPWIGNKNDNEYDDAGVLVSSATTEYGGGAGGIQPSTRRYTTDDDGNCSEITTTVGGVSSTEVRTYTDGKLAHVEGTGDRPSTQDLTYESGRLVLSIYRAENFFGGGQSESSDMHTYLPDGSEKIEYYDGFTDVISDRNRTVTRTAACLAIDAQIGAPKDNRCRVTH